MENPRTQLLSIIQKCNNSTFILGGGREYYRQIVFRDNAYFFESDTGEENRELSEQEVIDLLIDFADLYQRGRNLPPLTKLEEVLEVVTKEAI